ncbi:acetyltransferase [Aureimonas sp. SA4125]|uniref:GNAT family N-acetyltransferase n=1 Tax=Aureimonas sp. SA4125 TaxID=2826993 RepID=UPI001CC6B521|nr:GNAT family protein [Aureimonas sp. SA4125]BDA86899.1 acetyltransferase [Aureimonas sp. SA4125]
MDLTLRPFQDEDRAILAGWFGDEAALIQWGGPDMRFPLDEMQLRAMQAGAEEEPPRRLLWTGLRAGRVAAHGQVFLDWRHGVARLARIAVDPACRGEGLAVPFLDMLILGVWARPEFFRIELNVYTFNTAAIRAYRRLGFAEEGVRRSAVAVGSDRWDVAHYALLPAERPGVEETRPGAG